MSENASGASKAPKPVIEQTAFDEASNAEDTARAAEQASGAARSASAGEPSNTATAAPSAAKSFQDATLGFFQAFGRAAWAYADAHPHTVMYAFVGFVLAILILVIGLWDTILIAAFVMIGAIIGQAVDGDNAIVNFFSNLFSGQR